VSAKEATHRGPPPTLKSVVVAAAVTDEGYQFVRPRQRPGQTLIVMSSWWWKGVPTDLSSSLMRVNHSLPTHYFNYPGLQHHRQNCKRPQKSLTLHAFGGSMTYVDAIGWCVVRVGRDDSCARPASHASHNTLPSHGDRDTFRLQCRHHLSLVASLSLTLSSPWLRCASSHARETLWLKRQQWGRRRNYSYTRSSVLLYLLSLLKMINEDGSVIIVEV
jgi:hypothetical protein